MFVIKAVVFLILLSGFLISTTITNILFADIKKKVVYSSKLSSFFSALALRLLGFKIAVRKIFDPFKSSQNFLIVSNHLSYMDMFIISSEINCIFIAASDGAQEQFPLSWVTKNSGGIFIERKNKMNLKDEVSKIRKALDNGFNVVLFPEGTTSDGNEMLNFRSPFFSAVFKSDTKILPVCINYKKINRIKANKENRQLVCYSEEISFFKHFFRLLTLSGIDAQISFLDLIDTSSFKSRKELSMATFEKINNYYKSEL